MNILKQNAENFPTNNNKKKTLQISKTIKTQTTLPLMTTKSKVESTWAEDKGQFLYHLDPNTRKITRILKNNQYCSIVFNKTCLNKHTHTLYYYPCGYCGNIIGLLCVNSKVDPATNGYPGYDTKLHMMMRLQFNGSV